MSLKILWRSTVFLLTLGLIYLAFPILIVPSSLPAIQTMVIDNQYLSEYPNSTAFVSDQDSDLQILELRLPDGPSVDQKIQLIKDLHRQGMDLILNHALP